MNACRALCLALALLPVAVAAEEAIENITAAIETAPVIERELATRITAFGRVTAAAEQQATVALPRPGLVTRVWVQLGQSVAQGAPLFELTTGAPSRLEYQQAQIAVEFERAALARTQQLRAEHLATNEQVAAAERAVREAATRLAAARALGSAAETEIVSAPRTGVVTQLTVSAGQRVAADTPAATIASTVVVVLGLPLEEAALIKRQQAVSVRSVLRSSIAFDTVISATSAQLDPLTQLMNVFVATPPTVATQLLVNETVRGDIEVARQTMLAVPRGAVLEDAAGDYVFAVRAGVAHRIAVTIGPAENGLRGVVGKLTLGEAVVAVGNYELSDGMTVRSRHP